VVKDQGRVSSKRRVDVSREVWERLPFWVKELLKMLKDSGL